MSGRNLDRQPSRRDLTQLPSPNMVKCGVVEFPVLGRLLLATVLALYVFGKLVVSFLGTLVYI